MRNYSKLRARQFLTAQIKYIKKMGAILCRIVTQLNATHEKRLPLGKVKYWSTSLFCGERGVRRNAGSFGVWLKCCPRSALPLRKALFACWLRASMYLWFSQASFCSYVDEGSCSWEHRVWAKPLSNCSLWYWARFQPTQVLYMQYLISLPFTNNPRYPKFIHDGLLWIVLCGNRLR